MNSPSRVGFLPSSKKEERFVMEKEYEVWFTYDGEHYKRERIFAEDEESALKKADKVHRVMRQCGWFAEYANEIQQA